jgi:hypothetical protein
MKLTIVLKAGRRYRGSLTPFSTIAHVSVHSYPGLLLVVDATRLI